MKGKSILGLFSQGDDSGEAVGVALMLGEIRDLRGTMDKHDERLRGEIGGIKQSVADLSQAVLRSQGDMGAIRTDVDRITESVDDLRGEVSDVKGDVQELKTAAELENASWRGPQKLGRNVILVASVLGALGVIVKFWPDIWAVFAPT